MKMILLIGSADSAANYDDDDSCTLLDKWLFKRDKNT